MDIYREEILDHYKNPRNFGGVDKMDKKFKSENVSCGDVVKMGVKFEVTNLENIVKDIRFEGEGCAVSMAAASMLTEMVKGKSLKESVKIDEKRLLNRLRIPINSARKKCATLGLEAWQRLQKQV